MATIRQRLHRKNDEGIYDIIHLETASDNVLCTDGQRLETKLISLPKPIDSSSTIPAAGEFLVSPTGEILVGLGDKTATFSPSVTYKWKKYNVINTTTYSWTRYTIKTTYTWDRYYATKNYSTSTSTIYNTSEYAAYSGVQGPAGGLAGSGYYIASTGELALSGLTTIGSDGFIYNAYNRLYGVYANGGCGVTIAIGTKKAIYVTCTGESHGAVLAYPVYYTNGGGYVDTIKTVVSGATQGAYIDQVSSSSSGSYPNNGYSGDYWYSYLGVSQSAQSPSGTVSSTNSNAYPNNGISGSYWYIYSTSSTSSSRGPYIEDVTSTNSSAYPANGISGSYWYVKE